MRLIPKSTVGKMLEVKKELFEVLKELVAAGAEKDLNVKIFHDETGEPMIITAAYIDPVNGRLALQNLNGDRLFVEDLSTSEEPADFVMSIAEITKVITAMENKLKTVECAKYQIAKIAEAAGLTVEIK